MTIYSPSIFRSLFAILFCGMTGLSTIAFAAGPENSINKVSTEELLGRATKKAQETHLQFVKVLATRPQSAREYAVKKGFPTSSGEIDFVWLTNPRWDGQKFTAIVSDIPDSIRSLKRGERVQISPNELVDWMYVDRNQLVGGFTIRAMFHESPASERKAAEEELGMKIPSVDF